MSTLKLQFGRRLRFLRRQKDYTQEEIAEAVGISVEFLSNLERGINAPSFVTLEKLAKALGVEVKEFFSFKDIQPDGRFTPDI